jgi:hypothetical protein
VDLVTDLDKHTFIDCDKNFAICFALVGQDAGHQRGDAVTSARQETNRSLPRLEDDAQYAGFVGEDTQR